MNWKGGLVGTLSSLALACGTPQTAVIPPPVLQRAPVADVQDFNPQRLGNVDLSRKKVLVHYQVMGDAGHLVPYRKHERMIVENVRSLYSRYGVDLEFMTSGAFPFRQDVASVRVVVADEDTFYALLARYMENLGERVVLKASYGNTEPPERTIYFKILDSDTDLERQEGDWAVDMSDALAHEFDHLFSLLHTNTSPYDGTESMLTRYRHNLMKPDHPVITSCGGEICGRLNPTQVKQIHSYLSRGDAYRAFLDVGNDLERFKNVYAKTPPFTKR